MPLDSLSVTTSPAAECTFLFHLPLLCACVSSAHGAYAQRVLRLDREVLTCSDVMRASAMSMKHALSPVDISMGQTTDRPSVQITQTLPRVSHCADAEFALTMFLVELEQKDFHTTTATDAPVHVRPSPSPCAAAP